MVAALTAGLIAGAATASLAGAVVVIVVGAGVLATATALLISQIAVVTATSRPPAAAGAAAGVGDKAADQRRWKDADWQVDCVASRLPTGGLTLVHQHVRALVPLGATVRVQVASARHADVYARYGLRPLPTKPLRLVTRDGGAESAHGKPHTAVRTGDDASSGDAARTLDR